MKLSTAAILLSSTASLVSAFTTPAVTQRTFRVNGGIATTQLNGLYDDNLESALERELDYKPGQAKGDLAKRFGHLVGVEVRTVGEAFSDFTRILGCSINALYKNMVTDIVGSTHLTVVDARFKRNPLWSLGLLNTMDFLLKNYPERDIAERIVSALIQSIGMDEAEIRAEANHVLDYIEGKTVEDITADIESAEGSSPIASFSADAKADQFWMYSRFIGLGLVKVSEVVGVEQTADSAGQQIEKWMYAMDKPTYTAMADSDQWFRTKAKLDMMETLMKEIEIREKKRMADRLEEKAEMALMKAETEAKMQKELEEKEKARTESLQGV
eukprot:CAMPEP_0196811564 /NCGR_PEP_ID=MMETSP1362-20130617/18654_1 /TAXON_ID=163516 /ORGANISM="Leptocylindrus danicus, Strain CCMP1856" /LENGTH=327 /DNA_ID=CAMNT_0042186895 /DNA_START=122 /DNA_END=1105 /DNA_ORIENTATION=+